MTHITVELNDETYENLTRQAVKNGLSTEEELQRILAKSLESFSRKRLSREEFLRRARDLKKRTGPQKTDSTDIIRDLREHS